MLITISEEIEFILAVSTASMTFVNLRNVVIDLEFAFLILYTILPKFLMLTPKKHLRHNYTFFSIRFNNGLGLGVHDNWHY